MPDFVEALDADVVGDDDIHSTRHGTTGKLPYIVQAESRKYQGNDLPHIFPMCDPSRFWNDYHVITTTYKGKNVTASIFYTADGTIVEIEPFSRETLTEIVKDIMKFIVSHETFH